ncbi:MAG: DnaA/Hda family protein [Planctomycetia bacterium]|nr:DnaA/Hda family protein [Planctomycetia bacterium]
MRSKPLNPEETKEIDPGDFHWLPLTERPMEDLIRRGGSMSIPPLPDGFLAGPENRLAETAVHWFLEGIPSPKSGQSSSSSPSIPYREIPDLSPLVFYGPPGTGKTALARGIHFGLGEIRAKYQGIFMRGIDFFREFTQAVREERTAGFAGRFEKQDLLVFDDLQDLSGHSSALEEFLAILDQARSGHIPVIITLPASPEEIREFSPSLAARLIGGFLVPVAPPSKETRSLILLKIAELSGRKLSEEVLKCMLDYFPKTVGPICGSFARFLHQYCRNNRPITMAALREFLDQNSPVKEKSIEEIVRATAQFYAVRIPEIKGKSRLKTAVRARNVAIWLARKYTKATLQELGSWFSGRNHTTIMHSCREIDALIPEERALQESIDTLVKQIFE